MDYKYPWGSWRYKLTITLNTPAGEVSGSAVREIADQTPIISLPESTAPAQEKGEAVVVNIAEGKNLFALIGSDSDQEVYQAFPYPGGYRSNIVYYRSLKPSLKVDLPLRAWPRMVTFTDQNDPKTVQSLLSIQRCYAGISKEAQAKCEESGPHITENKFEEYFGEGVSIKSVTVEITDEPVTQDLVNQYLPWLQEYKAKKARLNGSTSLAIKTNELADNLGTGAFSTGVKKQ